MHDPVIFDCDGVLVDSEVTSNQVAMNNLARYGLTLTLPQCMSQFVGGTMTDVKEKAQALGAELPDNWLDEVNCEIHDRLRAGVPVIKGIPELLATLDENGIPFCVASNGSREKMRVTLGQNGLWDRFSDAMFSAYEQGVGKPDPTMFLTAARHFGARSPVVVEDSKNGVKAAIRAEMRCLAYSAHDDGDGLAQLGAEVFHDMADAPALLGI
ncbi:MAG: HAD family hydrolase [Ruegeria sp.]